MSNVIDLNSSYFHLRDTRAETMPGGAAFWARLAGGDLELPGWLVATFEFPDRGDLDGGHSEVHPNGDELLICLAGSMTAVLEHPDGEERMEFAAGQVCFIPAGTWHRVAPNEAGRMLSLTFGDGTEHRPTRPAAVGADR